MNKALLSAISFLLLLCHPSFAQERKTGLDFANPEHTRPEAMQCVAFSPYIGNLNPDYGPHPSKELINELLDIVVKETPFRCIMTYGVLNGLEAIFPAAESRNLKVIAIIWLDKDISVNSQSISKGIAIAKTFPKTIVKISCGSEVRTRHGFQFDNEISRCLDAFREAGVTQPLTTIDTWWEWCNRATPCQQTSFAKAVDWIGTNIFPWWENRHSGMVLEAFSESWKLSNEGQFGSFWGICRNTPFSCIKGIEPVKKSLSLIFKPIIQVRI